MLCASSLAAVILKRPARPPGLSNRRAVSLNTETAPGPHSSQVSVHPTYMLRVLQESCVHLMLSQLVTWHFHPVLPFVMGVLQTTQQAPQVVIYHRA